MAFLGQEFDSTQVEPSKPRDVIPPGTYMSYIDASDMKPTKKAQADEAYGGPAANDRLLALTFKIVGGEHDGALVFNNLNIMNSNPTAQEIAQKDLSAICRAIGKERIKDSNELHNKPMQITVDVERKEGYSPKNIIKGYKSVGSEAVAPAATGEAPKPAAKPAWAAK